MNEIEERKYYFEMNSRSPYSTLPHLSFAQNEKFHFNFYLFRILISLTFLFCLK